MESQDAHNEDWDLSGWAPLLESLKGKPHGFLLPEGYFESLPAEIQDQLEVGETDDSFLQDIGKDRSDLNVPEGYFQTLPDQIMDRIAASDTPMLDGLKEGKPELHVPKGYFQQLPDQIMARIEAEEAETTAPAEETPKRGKVISLFSFRRVAVGVAASVLIVLGINQFQSTPVEDGQMADWMEWTDAEIDTADLWFDDASYYIDDEAIALYMADEEGDFVSFEAIEETSDEEASDVIDYLMDVNVDLETIIEEM